MFGTNPAGPNVLGDSSTFDGGKVSFDWGVVPVNIMSAQVLRVQIVGGSAGGTKPFPDSPNVNALAADSNFKSVFDRMPQQLNNVFSTGSRKWGMALEKSAAKGEFGAVGKAASGGIGVAAGAFVGALGKAKELFIDPLVDAASNGFKVGINQGMGVETVGKSFEVLGTSVGTIFLGSTLKFAAAVLVFADAVNRNKDWLPDFGDMSGGLGIYGNIISFADWGEKRFRRNFYSDEWNKDFEKKFGNRSLLGAGMDVTASLLGITGLKDFSRASLGYGPTGKGPLGNDPLKDKMSLLLTRLENMQGGHASYYGIADVREQAQLAALNQDPLDAEMKKQMLDAVREISGNTAKTADNTKPQT